MPIGGGCNALIGTIVFTAFCYDNGSGVAVTSFPIPNNTAFAGISLFAQGFTLDPGVARGFAGSQGFQFTIGD